jgi:hypothetical protein
MVILFIPVVCGQVFESARISRMFYCFCWSGEKNISRNTRQEDEGMFKGTMFILLLLKNNNPHYKKCKSVPKKKVLINKYGITRIT